MKVERGDYVLNPMGLPETVSGKEELLQRAGMCIALRRGCFPYDRSLGSELWRWEPEAEHSEERATALANEALLELPGLRAVSAQITSGGVIFTIVTPLGEGEVTVGEL